MSNDPLANLEEMYSYLDSARDADGPGHVVVDAMMLSDWCSALSRAIGEADGSTLAGQQDAIALLHAEIERLRDWLREALDELDAYYLSEYGTDHPYHARKLGQARGSWSGARAALERKP